MDIHRTEEAAALDVSLPDYTHLTYEAWATD